MQSWEMRDTDLLAFFFIKTALALLLYELLHLYLRHLMFLCVTWLPSKSQALGETGSRGNFIYW